MTIVASSVKLSGSPAKTSNIARENILVALMTIDAARAQFAYGLVRENIFEKSISFFKESPSLMAAFCFKEVFLA